MINGKIPKLPETIIDFSAGQTTLTGYASNFTIPATLEVLLLTFSRISGPMLNITNSSLTTILMSYNFMRGPLSSLPKSLVTLDLYVNSLSGPIENLPANLTYLDLGSNDFRGSLPAYGNLEHIGLSQNHFYGQLPKFSPFIKYLDVGYNLLNGTVPTLPESLESIILTNNSFKGVFPSFPTNLTTIKISSNQFTSFETPLMNVYLLDASNNTLSGNITFGNQYKIAYFYVQNNFISNISILDRSCLQACDYSNNPLKHLPVISSRCIKDNLYYPNGYFIANTTIRTQLTHTHSTTDVNRRTTISPLVYTSSLSNQLRTRIKLPSTTESMFIYTTASNAYSIQLQSTMSSHSIPVEYISYAIILFTLNITISSIGRLFISFIFLVVLLYKLYKRHKNKHRKHTPLQRLTLSDDN